jgi:hypothetical protein
LAAWLDAAQREQVFAQAPPGAGIWIGDVVEFGLERELIPVRFAGADFLFLFLSPHSEADDDPEVLAQGLDTLDIKDFTPLRQSRLIKFCRAEAEEKHYDPNEWSLSEPRQIFQFAEILKAVVLLYLETAEAVQQFFYLPASKSLGRLYVRVFQRLTRELEGKFVAILGLEGACHAYQRS